MTSEVGGSFLTRSFSWKVLLAVLLLHTRPAKVRTSVIEVFQREVGGVVLLQHVVFLNHGWFSMERFNGGEGRFTTF